MSESIIKKCCEDCPFHTGFESEDCVHPEVSGEYGVGFREFSSNDREFVLVEGQFMTYDPPIPSWCPWRKNKTLVLIFEP